MLLPAFASHRHTLLPRVVSIDYVVQNELKKSGSSFMATAKGLIEFGADESQLSHFRRRRGAMAIAFEFQITRVLFEVG